MVHGAGLARSSAMEQFAYGKMIPRGKRLPAGGRPGDTFAFYEDVDADNADTESKLGILYGHATVRFIFGINMYLTVFKYFRMLYIYMKVLNFMHHL